MRSETEAVASLPLEPRAKIERPLSVIEYFHASVGANRRAIKPPRAVTIVLEGEGPDFKPERWREALDRVSAENPGSRLRLIGNRWWARWVNDAKPPRLRFIERTDWDGRSEVGSDFLETEPLSLERGEAIELVLINESPRGRMIVLRFSHAVMDGRGALHFLRDLFSALRGDPLAGSNAGFSDVDLMGRLGPKKATGGLFRTEWLMGAPQGDEKGDHWQRIALKTGSRNITARSAAIIAEYFHKHSSWPALISVAVDLRRRLPGLVATTNFSSVLLVRLEKGEGQDVFRQKLGAMIENRIDLFFPRMLRLVQLLSLSRLDSLAAGAKGDYRRKRAIETVVISNLGRLDSQEFSCGDFRLSQLFIMPLVGSGIFFMLIGVDDRIELVLGMPKVLASNGRFADFVAYLQRRLSETEAGEQAQGMSADPVGTRSAS